MLAAGFASRRGGARLDGFAIWQAFSVLLPVRRSSRATTAELPASRICSNK
jgi:hypothetical protein